MDAVSIFIDINKWIIDINNSFIDINKYGLNVKTAAHRSRLRKARSWSSRNAAPYYDEVSGGMMNEWRKLLINRYDSDYAS